MFTFCGSVSLMVDFGGGGGGSTESTLMSFVYCSGLVDVYTDSIRNGYFYPDRLQTCL